LILNGNLTIANNASLDISDAVTNLATRIEILVGGNITDFNDQEPSTIPTLVEHDIGRTYTRRGLYIGMNMENPMGVRGCSSGGLHHCSSTNCYPLLHLQAVIADYYW
jgi:hypothetical protein